MPLVDFVRGRRTYEFGGRAYRIGPPTVETVYRLISMFPMEIEATRQVLSVEGLRVAAAIPVFAKRHDDFATVLETVVETEYPRDVWPLEKIAEASLSQCDVDRIVSAFTVTDPRDDVYDEAWHEDVAFCRLAKFYNVPPLDLAKWPFEAYLSAKDAGVRILNGDDTPKPYLKMPTDDRGIAVM